MPRAKTNTSAPATNKGRPHRGSWHQEWTTKSTQRTAENHFFGSAPSRRQTPILATWRAQTAQIPIPSPREEAPGVLISHDDANARRSQNGRETHLRHNDPSPEKKPIMPRLRGMMREEAGGGGISPSTPRLARPATALRRPLSREEMTSNDV